MISNYGTIFVAAGLLLAGCSSKENPPAVTSTEQEAPASLLNNPKVQTSAVAANASQAPILPKPDPAVPVSSYVDLNREPGGAALTYIVSAKSPDPLTDDDKLNRLSPSYYGESDAFKKKALAQTEMPRVDAALSDYRKNSYYTLPISSYAHQPLGLTNISIGPYDFNSKSFPLTSYGQNCWSGTLRNQQGMVLKILPSDLPCRLPVADEAQAKLIEAARAQNALGLQGTAYLFVPNVEKDTALAQASRAHVELVNSQTKVTLAKFDL